MISSARGFLLALLLGSLAQVCAAGALRYCEGEPELSTAAQDRLLRVAAIVKAELERSARSIALVARSGLALQHFEQRYSHAGLSLRASPNTAWSVRQLYYECDEQRPRIFDQGMSGFVLGANDPSEGYLSVVFLPAEAAAALERSALDDHQALQLLAATYSANAYAFGQRYQNCNQWLVELIAAAWGAQPLGEAPRRRAQQWLKDQGYAPSVLRLGWKPLMWLANLVPGLHSDDHPPEDIAAAQFKVSMPESIESFVHAMLPEATRMEFCYTEQHLVIRHSWVSIAPGCIPAEGDVVTALASATVTR